MKIQAVSWTNRAQNLQLLSLTLSVTKKKQTKHPPMSLYQHITTPHTLKKPCHHNLSSFLALWENSIKVMENKLHSHSYRCLLHIKAEEHQREPFGAFATEHFSSHTSEVNIFQQYSHFYLKTKYFGFTVYIPKLKIRRNTG